jgi:hypothetical protein
MRLSLLITVRPVQNSKPKTRFLLCVFVSVVTELRRRRRALLLQYLYHTTTMALNHPNGTELMESTTSTTDRVSTRPASIHDESVGAVAASSAASAAASASVVAVAFGYSRRLADETILFDTGTPAAHAASKQETPKHAYDPRSHHHLLGSERLQARLDSYCLGTAQEADDPQQPTSSFVPEPASASASASAVEAGGHFWQRPPAQQQMAEGADPYLDRAGLIHPAPPNYQLRERSQKSSTDHSSHNSRRQQQQRWGQHFGISPGAYAMGRWVGMTGVS